MKTAVDILLAGAGPASLRLAAACAKRGLKVTIVDPGPRRPFGATFGLFADELPAELLHTVRRQWPHVRVRTRRRAHTVNRPYVRLNSAQLHAHLYKDCEPACQFLEGRVAGCKPSPTGFEVRLESGRTVQARRVIDCTGHVRALHGDHGATLKQIAVGATLMGQHGMKSPLLMDFSGPDSGTFLYALPVSSTELFVEETHLITDEPANWRALEARLRQRLDRLGLEGELTVDERCLIPMDPNLPNRSSDILAYGAAAGMVHPATGYQLAASLAMAGPFAERLADTIGESPRSAAASCWTALWPPEARRVRALRRSGGRFLATLSHSEQAAFFDAFFSLRPALIEAYLTHHGSFAATCSAMLAVFRKLPVGLRLRVLRHEAMATLTVPGKARHRTDLSKDMNR